MGGGRSLGSSTLLPFFLFPILSCGKQCSVAVQLYTLSYLDGALLAMETVCVAVTLGAACSRVRGSQGIGQVVLSLIISLCEL